MSATDHRPDDASLETLSVQVREIHDELKQHVEREKSLLARAFPGGDVAAHRMAHEAMISAARAQEQFWRDLRLDIAKKGVWGLLIIVLGLVLVGASTKLGIRP